MGYNGYFIWWMNYSLGLNLLVLSFESSFFSFLLAVSFSKSNYKSKKLSQDSSTEIVLIWPMCSVVYYLVWFSLVRFSMSKLDKLIWSTQNAASPFYSFSSVLSIIVSSKFSYNFFGRYSWLVMIYSNTSYSKNYGQLSYFLSFTLFFLFLVDLLMVSSSTGIGGYNFLKQHLKEAMSNINTDINVRTLSMLLFPWDAWDGISQ